MASPTSFASPQRFKGHISPEHEALGAWDEMRAKPGSGGSGLVGDRGVQE